MSESFDNPKGVAINRVYTGRGDAGSTALVGGQRVSKEAPRIWAYGEDDELNAFVGSARESALDTGNADHAGLASALRRHQVPQPARLCPLRRSVRRTGNTSIMAVFPLTHRRRRINTRTGFPPSR